MNSIRTRLLVGLIGTILPLVLISYLVLYLYVAGALWRSYDGSLSTRLDSYAKMAEWEGADDIDFTEDDDYEDFGDDPANRVHFEFVEFDLPEYQPSRNAEYYQVWDLDGTVYARSPSLGGRDLSRPQRVAAFKRMEDVTLPDGRPGRLAFRTVVPEVDEYVSEDVDTEQAFVLALARPTENILETLALLRFSLVGAAVLTVGAAGGLIWIITRRELRPLQDISDELEMIGPDDLDRRVETATKPDELVPVCVQLNDLLDRLDEVIERERRFTSNVAHELRTPVAELRVLADVSAARDNLGEVDRRTYEDTAAIALRMERLIAALLELARCSSGQVVKDTTRANVKQLVDANWKPHRAAARAKGLDVHLPVDAETEIRTDPVILGTILTNLFANAVEYTPTGGTVDIAWTQDNGTIAFTIANTAEDLTPDDLSRLFDSFWRKDGPDSRTDEHLGLGLALARALSRVLGVRLEGRMANPRTLEIELIHPV